MNQISICFTVQDKKYKIKKLPTLVKYTADMALFDRRIETARGKIDGYQKREASLKTELDNILVQKRDYENKIKSNPDWEFVGVYGERKSGTHIENRDAFNKMFEDAKAHLVPGGRLYLVIRKQQGAASALKYLKEVYAQAETVDRGSGFHVLKAWL